MYTQAIRVLTSVSEYSLSVSEYSTSVSEYSPTAVCIVQESGKAKGKKKKEKKTLATDQLGFDYQVRSDGTPTEETRSIVYVVCVHDASL